MKITDSVIYIGVNDHNIDLFEGQYIVPNGMAYNSYAIIDEKIAIMDSVDINFTEEWLKKGITFDAISTGFFVNSKQIDISEEFIKKFKKEIGTSLVYLADEFYIKADKSLPSYDAYEDFPQIENGVGMWSLLKKEFDDAVKDLPEDYCLDAERKITMVTGVAAYGLISYIAEKIQSKTKNPANISTSKFSQ